MIFLMRHGEDDDSRLGGWSDASLCQNGIEQVKKSCERLKDSKYNIEYIFSSDLQRAKETADIVSEYLVIPVTHAGVINIIKCIETGIQFTNKEVKFKVKHAEIVPIEN